jgi:hypothetical protein
MHANTNTTCIQQPAKKKMADRWLSDGLGVDPIFRPPESEYWIQSQPFANNGLNSNKKFIGGNLLPLDVEAIKRNPLGELMEDTWAWTNRPKRILSMNHPGSCCIPSCVPQLRPSFLSIYSNVLERRQAIKLHQITLLKIY